MDIIHKKDYYSLYFMLALSLDRKIRNGYFIRCWEKISSSCQKNTILVKLCCHFIWLTVHTVLCDTGDKLNYIFNLKKLTQQFHGLSTCPATSLRNATGPTRGFSFTEFIVQLLATMFHLETFRGLFHK